MSCLHLIDFGGFCFALNNHAIKFWQKLVHFKFMFNVKLETQISYI